VSVKKKKKKPQVMNAFSPRKRPHELIDSKAIGTGLTKPFGIHIKPLCSLDARQSYKI
jgi:hypothetical protein